MILSKQFLKWVIGWRTNIMKFWQRIYIFSLILFILIFNLAGILIIENIHASNLKREVNRCLSEHLSIYSGINVSLPINDTLRRYSRNISSDDEVLQTAISTFYEKNNDKTIYIELLDKNSKTIFSNIDFNLPENREEIKSLSENKRQYIIKDIDNRAYIFISNPISMNNSNYTLTYIRNISSVYEDRENQYLFFIKLDILASLFFMILMYFLSKLITKPIKTLITATQKISKGEFTEQVNITSKDEIGLLAENFNLMAKVVNEKIIALENNNDEKQRFIDNLTHELKTPLTSIIGYSELLLTTKYNEEIFIDGLNFIYKEGKRLEELSFKLMDLILLNKEDFNLKSNYIKPVIIDAERILMPRLLNKNISLIITGDDFKIMMDADLMKVLLSNLIDNAIKASNENSEIYITLNNEKYEVTIQDYGIGISKEHLDKIFEPFYMVDKARSRASHGAGLGLSICKSILDVHNGNFHIFSEINEGTLIKLIFKAEVIDNEM